MGNGQGTPRKDLYHGRETPMKYVQVHEKQGAGHSSQTVGLIKNPEQAGFCPGFFMWFILTIIDIIKTVIEKKLMP